jgi:protein-S-isoprenylcysteine O-methyltransferase Ste14
MRATDFEFRNRFWLIGLIFAAGFLCYALDHANAAVALLRAISNAPLNLDLSRTRHELQAIIGVATLLVAASAAIRTWATAYLNSDVVHDANVRTEGLVADGPYRHVRNPLYLSNVLMSFGMGMLASRLGLVVIIAGMLLFTYRLIGYEEAQLLAAQDERYAAYRTAVPRLWPSPRPRVAFGGTKPRWGQAWLGEAFFWGFAAAIGAFAVTLDIRYTWGIMAVTFVFYIALTSMWSRKKRTPAP